MLESISGKKIAMNDFKSRDFLMSISDFRISPPPSPGLSLFVFPMFDHKKERKLVGGGEKKRIFVHLGIDLCPK